MEAVVKVLSSLSPEEWREADFYELQRQLENVHAATMALLAHQASIDLRIKEHETSAEHIEYVRLLSEKETLKEYMRSLQRAGTQLQSLLKASQV
jgi:hypothetical protein